MWKYLKAAFVEKIYFPLAGALPMNILAVSCGGIFGIAIHPIWLVTAGVEVVYLYWMATNPRYRAIVDGLALESARMDVAHCRQEIIESLSMASKRRLEAIEIKYNRVIKQYEKVSGSFVVSGNADALSRLMTMYLNLLVNAKSVDAAIKQVEDEQVAHRVNMLRNDLSQVVSPLSDTARESKNKTLAIMEQRLESYAQRKQQKVEIESDLERIEASIELALENASAPVAISASIDLVSHMISNDTFGATDSNGQVLYSHEVE